jgi:hypothetical protein
MANFLSKNGQVYRGRTCVTINSLASSRIYDEVAVQDSSRLPEARESSMQEPIGELKEMKPRVWVNPDAVAVATCVADGAWMMPTKSGGENGNGEPHCMLALTLWDGLSIVLTEMTDIVKASSVLKLPHPAM